jgi:epoxyqueuosine reductase
MHGNTFINQIQKWGRELGFSQIAVADVSSIDLSKAEAGLLAWLDKGCHGDMHYMAAHGTKRARPWALVEGTVSVITARMDYLPESHGTSWCEAEEKRIANPHEAVISVYARGRDYHKVMRTRLQTLSEKIALHLQASDLENRLQNSPVNSLASRVFVDSAPVLEVELASQSDLGWRGKHTLLLNRKAGSMFFLGEIFINIKLPPQPTQPPRRRQRPARAGSGPRWIRPRPA